MTVRQLVLLVLQLSIICTVFGYGLAAAVADLTYVLHRPWLLARSLVAVFVLMPVVAVALVLRLHVPHTTEVALVALAMCPVPPLLPLRQGKAGGNFRYGLGLVVVLSLASILAIPATAEILQYFFNRPYTITPSAIAPVVMTSTIVPLAAGLVVRALWPRVAARLLKPVGFIGNVLLPLAVVALVAGALSEIWAAVGNGTVLAIVVFTVAGLAIGHVLGGPNRGDSVVLAFSTACRHPALAVAISTTAYPDQRFGATILLYLLVNIVAGLPYLLWQRRLAAAG
jgi:BASS family bile acid:Na+ symporter